jgi:uncharacterized protein (DUF1015 family)
MPEIKPFRAFMYDPKREEISAVVAPPYDVISKERQEQLYNLSPHNIVRLILGREENRYASAAQLFEEWKGRGILEQEPEPAIYLLSQQFPGPGGQEIERRGFIAACRLEEFGHGSIYPHELTHPGPKEDRLRLFEATHAMFSQIFALYSDPRHSLDRHLEPYTGGAPDIDVVFDGVRNRVWKVRDGATILALEGFLKGQRALVADGHHRYETAVSYANARRLKNPRHTGTEPYNFVPIYFTNLNDPGLVILPTHRIIHGLPGFSQDRFLEEVKGSFEVRVESSAESLLRSLGAKGEGTFGLILAGDPGYTLLSYKKKAVPGMGEIPGMLARLDVTVLHTVILKGVLHLSDEDQAKKLHLEYEQDAEAAIQKVRRGEAQAAFLLNPTRVELLRAIAEGGFTMPQKSTYFFPKLLSGLVIYSFDGA